MKLTQLLDRPIAYHRCFVTLTGSVKAAILLSQAMYWQQRAKQADGWWYKTAEEWQEETGLTRHEQETARKDCEPFLMSDLRGVPATLYWKVNEDAIMKALFDDNSKSSFTESVKLDSRKQSNINKNTETTTETTQDIDTADISKKIDELKFKFNPNTPTLLKIWLEDYKFTSAVIIRALDMSRGKSVNYADAILTGWKRDGVPPTREELLAQKGSPRNANNSGSPTREIPEPTEAQLATARRILAQRAA
jgi:hypothetical protein